MKYRLKKNRYEVNGCPVLYVDSGEKVERVMRMLESAEKVGVDTEAYGCDVRTQHPFTLAKLFSMQFTCTGPKLENEPLSNYIFIPNWGEQTGYYRHFKSFLTDPTPKKLLHNAKFDMHVFANHGIRMRGLRADTFVKAYLQDTSQYHGLKEQVDYHFGIDTPTFGETFRVHKVKKNGMIGKAKILPSLPEIITGEYDYAFPVSGKQSLIEYAVQDTFYTNKLDTYLDKKLANMEWHGKKSMLDYYNEFELEFTDVLFNMERRGCKLDEEFLVGIQDRVTDRVLELEQAFFRTCVKLGVSPAGMENFNINSPKQLTWLFEEQLGVELPRTDPTPKRPRGTASTSDASLSQIRSRRARGLINILLEHRSLSQKLLGTYVDPFLHLVRESWSEGRLRTSLRHTGAVTMRLSCVASWTELRTPRGAVPIKDVKVGDHVWTHKGRWRRVLASFTKGFDDMYDVCLSNGEVLTCTTEHRLLDSNGQWFSVKELVHESFESVGQQTVEQRSGQSCSCYARRTQSRSLFAGKGLPCVEVEKVVYRGRFEVHDVTVEEDESYEACGVISHNSATPNLQNIPRYDPDGSQKDVYGIRSAFVATDGYELGDADLSQIEICLMAHFTNDPVMVEALNNGWDLHSRTATFCYPEVAQFVGKRALNKDILSDIKKHFPSQRQGAKTIGFMVGYGGGPGRYAEVMNTNINEGRRVVDTFFKAYRGLARGIKQVQQSAYEKGYVRTLLGRYIQVPYIRSSDKEKRAAAERRAFNFRIQGSAADIIKMAMLLIHRDDTIAKTGTEMTLQIHDELMFDIPKGAGRVVKPIIDDYMSNPYKHFGFKSLRVPTKGDLGIGRNWTEAKAA